MVFPELGLGTHGMSQGHLRGAPCREGEMAQDWWGMLKASSGCFAQSEFAQAGPHLASRTAPPPRVGGARRSSPPALHSCPGPAHRQKHPRTEQTNQPTEVSPAIHPNRKSQVRGPKRRRGGSGTLAQGLSPPTPPRDPFCRGAPFAQDLGVKGVKASRGSRRQGGNDSLGKVCIRQRTRAGVPGWLSQLNI